MRTSIKDIARATGFSITTVSLVLNNKDSKISAETSASIRAAAKQMHYRPNQLAVSLVKRQSKTIGLIVPDISNGYFSGLAKGIEFACRKYGRMVFLCNTNDFHERNVEYINRLAEMGVEGIIDIIAQNTTLEEGVAEDGLMNDLGIPHILVDRVPDAPGCVGIQCDHVLGGYLATRHLIDLGHRRIAFVTGPLLLGDARRRFLGYKKALAESGIPLDDSLIYQGNYTRECGIAAVDYWSSREYSAVFASNDESAFGVCQQLQAQGKSVPGDVSVVGYDDAVYAGMLGVPLTTVRQPIQEMGEEAARQLTQSIETRIPLNQPVLFQPRLIVRASTARRKEP